MLFFYASCASKTSPHHQNERGRLTTTRAPAPAEGGTYGDGAGEGGLIPLTVRIAEDGDVADNTPHEEDVTTHPAQITFAQTIKEDYAAFANLCQRLLLKAMTTSARIAGSLATTTRNTLTRIASPLVAPAKNAPTWIAGSLAATVHPLCTRSTIKNGMIHFGHGVLLATITMGGPTTVAVGGATAPLSLTTFWTAGHPLLPRNRRSLNRRPHHEQHIPEGL